MPGSDQNDNQEKKHDIKKWQQYNLDELLINNNDNDDDNDGYEDNNDDCDEANVIAYCLKAIMIIFIMMTMTVK